MIRLIGKDINGKTIIVKCEDQKAVARAKREYAKRGIALRSYDAAIKREANRLVNRPDEQPEYKF